MAHSRKPTPSPGTEALLHSFEGGLHGASKAAADEQLKLERLKQRAAASAERLASVDRESKRRDWTASYRAWDEWEDPEEVEDLERAAQAKADNAARRAAFAGCSHDHSAERAVYELSTSDKIRDCQRFKLAGNFFYREGQFFRAAERYRKILVYFEYAFPDTPEDEATLLGLRRHALLNLAACKLRTKQYDDCINFATQALNIDSECVKALYRRAQAYRHRDAFEEALADITSAIRLAPGDTLLRRELALLRNKMAAYHRKSKRVFRVVIGGDGAQRGSAGEGGDIDESEGGGASDCVEGSPGSEGDNDDELDVIGVDEHGGL